MAKFSMISKAASAAILGAVLLTGCGSSDTAAAVAGSTEVVAADGYVGKLKRAAVASKAGQDDVKSAIGNVTKGKIKFGKKLDKTWKIAIPADSLVDANNDGNISNDNNATVGFEMSTFGDEGLATPGSTFVYAVTDGNATAAEAYSDFLEFDPVAGSDDIASDNNDTKQKAENMLALLEMIKTVGKGSSVSEIAKLTITAADINSTDLNTSTKMDNLTFAGATEMKDLVAAKVAKLQSTIALVQAIKASGQEIDISTMMVRSSDGGENIVDLIEAEDINTSTMTSLISDANTSSNAIAAVEAAAVAAIPQKLILTGDTITVGSTDVVVSNNTFDLDLTIEDNATINDFASITFPAITVNKAKVDAGDYNATFSVMIETADEAKMLRLEIDGAKIALEANSTTPTVEFTTDTTVTIAQSGINSLSDINITSSITAEVNSPMTQSDFGFNINTLLENLVSDANSEKVEEALTAINGFLNTSSTYTVELGLKTDMFTDMGVLSEDNATREITGTVNVNMEPKDILAANQIIVDAALDHAKMYISSLADGYSVELPTSYNGATIVWTSNNAGISDTGTVTKVVGQTQTGTMTVTVTKGTLADATLADETFTSASITVAAGVESYDNELTDTGFAGTVANGVTLSADGATLKFNDQEAGALPVATTITDGTSEIALIDSTNGHAGAAYIFEYNSNSYEGTFGSADASVDITELTQQ